jgi:hypothetical protein
MPPKKNERDQAAMNKLFEQRSYMGGRLPEILGPVPPPAIQNAPKLVPVWEQPPEEQEPSDEDEPRKKRGPKSEKKTGLQVVLQQIRRDGFQHPVDHGNFLMLPKGYKALLSLETQAVAQIVLEIFERTIGWVDKSGKLGRREWARISVRDFELACGITEKQAKAGIKKALQQGYILRRPKLGSFEFSIRWAEKSEPSSFPEMSGQ